MEKPFVYTFPNKRTAQVVQMQRMEELPRAQRLVASGLLQIVNPNDGFEMLLKTMKGYFEG
jgi:hypothetical protein